MITHRLVVSYTTFSPLPHTRRGGCFLLPTPAVADSFYFRKWGSLCCPDFPLLRLCTAATEPRHCFQQTAKLLKKNGKNIFIYQYFQKILEEEPENKNLQKQIVLLNDANISTIHSFCLEVIKNYFYEIGISPNFRIGDNAEIKLLKQETLEEVFEELYEEENKDFIKLVDTYCGYRNDNQLRELVLKIYNYSQSMPFPMEWISENVDKFNITNKTDFSQTEWGKLLIKNFKEEAQSAVTALKTVKNEL